MKKIDSIFLEIIELFIALVGILGVGVYTLLSVSAYTSLSSYNSPSISEHRQLFIFTLFVSIICLILSIRLVLRIWEEHQSIQFYMGALSLIACGVSVLLGIVTFSLLSPLALFIGGISGLNGWYEIKSKNNVRLEAAFSLISAVLICVAGFALVIGIGTGV